MFTWSQFQRECVDSLLGLHLEELAPCWTGSPWLKTTHRYIYAMTACLALAAVQTDTHRHNRAARAVLRTSLRWEAPHICFFTVFQPSAALRRTRAVISCTLALWAAISCTQTSNSHTLNIHLYTRGGVSSQVWVGSNWEKSQMLVLFN